MLTVDSVIDGMNYTGILSGIFMEVEDGISIQRKGARTLRKNERNLKKTLYLCSFY